MTSRHIASRGRRLPRCSNFCIRFTAFLAVFIIFTNGAEAKKHRPINLVIGNNVQSFHVGINGKKIHAGWPSNEHDQNFLEDIINISGMTQDILMLEADVPNAYALIDYQKSPPFKLVIYNFDWVRKHAIDPTLLRYLVIAHEIGHHACTHPAGRLSGLPLNQELEADRFAGSVIRRLSDAQIMVGSTPDLGHMLESLRQILPYAGSDTHPALKDRMNAFSEGWTGDKIPCR
ncbi:hypothetical protein [Bosea sp. 2RAB26]|uniref:hypothetical protein n=1 Tax=Bosea sp. 2RAB26 TaxID=3237476 RepID=UPI003F904E10